MNIKFKNYIQMIFLQRNLKKQMPVQSMIKVVFPLYFHLQLVLSTESPLELSGAAIKMESYYPNYFIRYPLSQQAKNIHNMFCFREMTYTVGEGFAEMPCPFDQVTNSDEYKCVYFTTDSSLSRRYSSKKFGFVGNSSNSTEEEETEPPNFFHFDMIYQRYGEIQLTETADTYLQTYSTEQIIDFQNDYFKKEKFYHMISCEVFKIDFSNSENECQTEWKENYIHTYHHELFTQNLIVQRHHQCKLYSGNSANDIPFTYQLHVFYGGVVRNGIFLMFNSAVIVRLYSELFLNMWGGFLYSISHINRDGMCFSTHTGTAHDILSLLASGMYDDTDDNINAVDSLQVSSNTHHKEVTQFKHYFIQYYRSYDTEDFTGDEKIHLNVMYPKFSFAAYFDHENNTNELSCFSQLMKHEVVMSYSVDLNLNGGLMEVAFGLLLFIMLN